jgi:hypothetical protein
LRRALKDASNDKDIRIGFTRAELHKIRAEAKAEVEELKALIVDLENPLKPYYGEFRLPVEQLKLGSVGSFDEEVMRVLQVIDDMNVLVKRSYTTPYSNQSLIKIVLVSGMPTSHLEDDGPITLNGLFAITKNTTYETTNGTSTVFVLERIDPAPFADKFTRRSEVRTWTSKTGKYSTDAIFVRAERGDVVLMKPNGKSTTVKLSKLSDADRNFVKDQIRKDAELQKQIPPKQRYRHTKRDGSIVLESL